MKFYYFFEKSLKNFKMFLKMSKFFFIGIFIIQLVIVSFFGVIQVNAIKDIEVPVSNQKISNNAILHYYFNLSLGFVKTIKIPREFLPMYQKMGYRNSSINRELFKSDLDEITGDGLKHFFPNLKKVFYNTFYLHFISLFCLILFSLMSMYLSSSKYVRGSKLTPIKEIKKELKKLSKNNTDNIKIGDLNLLRSFETSHTLVLGSTGTGKSVLINQMISQLQKRKKKPNLKEKMIIYDVKGEYLSKWYDKGGKDQKPDIIFYPADKRSINYSLFSEIRDEMDFKIIAKSLFEPSEETKDKFFDETAGKLFQTGLIWLSENNKKNNRDILQFFSVSRETIIDRIKELPMEYHGVATYIESERQGNSILSTLLQKIDFLHCLIDADGVFSFRDYIRDEKDKRSLYLLNMPKFNMIYKPLLTFVINIMIREVLSLKDDPERRVFFLIDEFGSLSKVEAIISFLKESRSKGGALIAGNQDLGDIQKIYGRELKTSFYNNFNTNFIFRVNDPDTASFLSRAIGEAEVYKEIGSTQINSKNNNAQSSINTQNKQESVLLPAEFLNLEIFSSVIKISGIGVFFFKIPENFYNAVYPHYLEKGDD